MEDKSLNEIEERAMYAAFFSSSEDYYLKCLDKVKKGIVINPNIYAFIGNVFWFCYRRMTLETIVISLIIYALFTFSFFVNISFLLLYIVFSLILGLIGNYLYIKKAIKVIKKANEYERLGDKFTYIREKGGTNIFDSLLIVFIPVLFLIAFIIFVSFIMSDPAM